MVLECLCRLESVDAGDVARERGVIKGLRMVIARLDELKKTNREEGEE